MSGPLWPVDSPHKGPVMREEIPRHDVFMYRNINNRPPSQYMYKDGLSRNGDFNYNVKTVVRPSYLYIGNPYTGKTYLYWDGPQVPHLRG